MPFSPMHEHVFIGAGQRRNERRIWWVIGLTAATMLAELIGGTVFGSMALVADGWHMSTHAGALLISALAYRYARRHAHDPRFSFGTGKLGDLAGFASAIALAIVALLIAFESVQRLLAPVPIHFSQAMGVAIIGLAVNLLSAWLLRDEHHHASHGHDHDHAHGHDNNLRAAYLHVVADALTSVLAIAALLLVSVFGWVWADPLMGVVGALVILRWSWSLIREVSLVLLDAQPAHDDKAARIRAQLEDDGVELFDLHIWQIAPGRYAAIVALGGDRATASVLLQGAAWPYGMAGASVGGG
ncbi:CDF family Co(II)/Ni(II) efflux transporter DmeF [Pseudomonas aeruginosa]